MLSACKGVQEGGKEMRYGMVIDLQKCTGCNSCTVACRAEKGTPAGVHFHKVMKYEVGKYPNAKMKFLPMPCMHCQDPPCLKVCPTGATYIHPDGLVLLDEKICIGCRACMVACPYESRQFLWEIRNYYPGSPPTPYEKIKQKGFEKGTVVKCNFCLQRLEEGKEPACVATCPATARTFGDLDDPENEVSRLIVMHRGSRFREELGTEPSVFYIKG
jgi:molybdopterin-containing oxidoreductase family iron-sulfur binding subunit